MCNPDRTGNQIWIKRVPRMLAEEFRIRGKQAGIQDFQHPGEVDLGILCIRMVTMNAESQSAQQYKAGDAFDAQSESLPSFSTFAGGTKARTARITISGSICRR